MQIDDKVRHIISARNIGVPLNQEYSQDQLVTIYVSIINYLNDKLAKTSSVPKVDTESDLSSEDICLFKQQLSLLLTDQSYSDIIDFYNAAYLAALEPEKAKVVCEALAQSMFAKRLPVPQLWMDTLASNGAVPQVYLN